MLFPTRRQWSKWSLPSKLGAIGTYVAVIGFLYVVVPDLYKHISGSTDDGPEPTVVVHTKVYLEYPGPLVYVYNSSEGRLIAPIGIAVHLGISNRGSQPYFVNSYALDLHIDGEWERVSHLPVIAPREIYWINNSMLADCTRVDFSHDAFDTKARDSGVLPGYVLDGWVFFEWPKHLRAKLVTPDRLRITLTDDTAVSYCFEYDAVTDIDDGEALFHGGGWSIEPESVDLEGLQIKAWMDITHDVGEG